MFRNFIKHFKWHCIFVAGMVFLVIFYFYGLSVPLWLFWLVAIALTAWIGYTLVRDYIKYYKASKRGQERRGDCYRGIDYCFDADGRAVGEVQRAIRAAFPAIL